MEQTEQYLEEQLEIQISIYNRHCGNVFTLREDLAYEEEQMLHSEREMNKLKALLDSKIVK